MSKATQNYHEFKAEEGECPRCAKGSGDATVCWIAAERKFKCYCCGWVDTRMTAKGKKLLKLTKMV